MEITFLGHSGFLVETSDWILLTDPWLSADGAYEMAWFQFPRNHHLAAGLVTKIRDTQKKVYVFISHEHKDHFDLAFLATLPTQKVQAVVPFFRRKTLLESCESLNFNTITEVKDGEIFPVAGGSFQLFIEDAELDRDSAILIESDDTTFLNLNDCKIYDRIPEIRNTHKDIDVFTAQFSGATWHPVCYSYEQEQYRKISKIKRNNKFKTLARAVDLLKPKYFIPSAGPACFLDPSLFHLNFEEDTVFPKNPEFLTYLKAELGPGLPRVLDLFPGDTFKSTLQKTTQDLSQPRPSTPEMIRDYLVDYARDYADAFRERKKRSLNLPDVLARLRRELQRKMDSFPIRKNLEVPLYFGLLEWNSEILQVNFYTGRVEIAPFSEPAPPYYRVRAEAHQILSVLDGLMNWEDFTLTFRARIDRDPDDYKTLMIAFIAVEAEDLPDFSKKWLSLQQNQKRIRIQAGTSEYEISHYCPHQGADLSVGWSEESRYWVCPKHGWKFDLEKEGLCSLNASTIQAKKCSPN